MLLCCLYCIVSYWIVGLSYSSRQWFIWGGLLCVASIVYTAVLNALSCACCASDNSSWIKEWLLHFPCQTGYPKIHAGNCIQDIQNGGSQTPIGIDVECLLHNVRQPQCSSPAVTAIKLSWWAVVWAIPSLSGCPVQGEWREGAAAFHYLVSTRGVSVRAQTPSGHHCTGHNVRSSQINDD